MKRNNREDINSIKVLSILFFFAIIFIIRVIIDSWKWLYALIFLGIWIICYLTVTYLLKRLDKKKKETPASLWKEFKYKYPIIIQYLPPKDLNPAEAWLLYNCKVDVSDLTSLIYQWAFEWLISIKNIKVKENKNTISKIELHREKVIDEERPFFEKEIFNSIFCTGEKKIITNSFELRYALLLEDLEFHWIKKWWVYRNTWWKALKIIYLILLWALIFSLFELIEHFYDWKLIVPLFLLFFALLLACIFLWWYIDWGTKLRLTDKWAKLAAYIIGYRNFIKSCDENMIKLFLEQDPLFIDRTIPYATAFWLETEFLDKVTPLAQDWKAQYVNWHKVTTGMKIFAYLLKPTNKDNYNFFYRW